MSKTPITDAMAATLAYGPDSPFAKPAVDKCRELEVKLAEAQVTINGLMKKQMQLADSLSAVAGARDKLIADLAHAKAAHCDTINQRTELVTALTEAIRVRTAYLSRADDDDRPPIKWDKYLQQWTEALKEDNTTPKVSP